PPYYRAGWGGPPPSAPQPFAGPAPWSPGQPPPPRKRNPWPIVVGAAAVVVGLVLLAVGTPLAMGHADTTNPGRTTPTPPTTTPTATTSRTTTTSVPPSTPPPEAQNRLLSLLPAGYPPGVCKPEGQPIPGSIVSVMCGQNTDPNGPSVAEYGLFGD